MEERVKKKLAKIPQNPGVYQFLNSHGTILYIGKAKNLRKRVQSYFRKSANLTDSKRVMVHSIADIKTIITDSELEALLLESTLIKEHQPRYNVALKDGKQYVYIKIDRTDDFPKILVTRDISDQKSRYFGPFTDAYSTRETLKIIRKLFPYRDCNLKITKENYLTHKYKPCLKYYIKLCAGPCDGKISHEEHDQLISHVVLFLQGHGKKVLSDLKRSMKKASQNKEFESAAIMRDQIRALERILAKQKVISSKKVSEDYISTYLDGKKQALSLILVRDGKLVAQENFHIQAPPDVDEAEVIASFMVNHYQKTRNIPKTIVLPQEPLISESDFKKILTSTGIPADQARKITFTVPQRGNKKNILELGVKNAKNFIKRHVDTEKKTDFALNEIKETLGLSLPPRRIECFDISNIQGTNPVASMSVFVDGVPAKKEYRLFNIKTIEGANDFAMIHEAFSRRLKKTFVEKKWPKPDLVVIDGGKGQLSSARKAMKELGVYVPLISIAKREEELFTLKSQHPILLPKTSEGLKILQQIRDEAHRFAITAHKKKRQKKAIASRLDGIPGVGPKSRKKLLIAFGSVSQIKKASVEDLSKIVPKKTAQTILKHLNS